MIKYFRPANIYKFSKKYIETQDKTRLNVDIKEYCNIKNFKVFKGFIEDLNINRYLITIDEKEYLMFNLQELKEFLIDNNINSDLKFKDCN